MTPAPTLAERRFKLPLIRAFRHARPYWLWRIEPHDNGLRAQVCRGLATVGWIYLDEYSGLRLDWPAGRRLPNEMELALRSFARERRG